MTIQRYTPTHADEWNAFVAQSKNGTFLFDRRYMDYHADRFHDCSLLFYKDNRLIALLPAHIEVSQSPPQSSEGDVQAEKASPRGGLEGAFPPLTSLISHAGLTYGGLVMARDFSPMLAVECFEQLNSWCREQGISRVVYKPVPHIYHRLHAEDDLYALHHICHARLIGRDAGTDIIRSRAPRWERIRRRGVKRATDAAVTVGRSDDYAAFWRILSDNLQTRYGVHPVHTLEEILLLHSRFPDNIALFCACRSAGGSPATGNADAPVRNNSTPLGRGRLARDEQNIARNDHLLAGLLLYITPTVVHAQYSAATPEGKQLGAMDALYHHVLNNEYADIPHFDFGRSTEGPAGDVLNPRLIFQKQGYGGTTVCYDTYEWDIT